MVLDIQNRHILRNQNVSDVIEDGFSKMNNTLEWTGDLDDDCMAVHRNFMLHAEAMDDDEWWWAIYDNGREVDSSHNTHPDFPKTGVEARDAAELALVSYLANC